MKLGYQVILSHLSAPNKNKIKTIRFNNFIHMNRPSQAASI